MLSIMSCTNTASAFATAAVCGESWMKSQDYIVVGAAAAAFGSCIWRKKRNKIMHANLKNRITLIHSRAPGVTRTSRLPLSLHVLPLNSRFLIKSLGWQWAVFPFRVCLIVIEYFSHGFNMTNTEIFKSIFSLLR